MPAHTLGPGPRPGCSSGLPPSHNLPAMLATAWSPDEHCLLTVDKGTVSGMSLKQKVRPLSQPPSPARLSEETSLCSRSIRLPHQRMQRPGEQTQQPCPHSRPAPRCVDPISAGTYSSEPHQHTPFHPRILLSRGPAQLEGKEGWLGHRGSSFLPFED